MAIVEDANPNQEVLAGVTINMTNNTFRRITPSIDKTIKFRDLLISIEAVGFIYYIESSNNHFDIIQSENGLTMFPNNGKISIKKKDFPKICNIADKIFKGEHNKDDYKNREYIKDLANKRDEFLREVCKFKVENKYKRIEEFLLVFVEE